jgi:hypothetical protein
MTQMQMLFYILDRIHSMWSQGPEYAFPALFLLSPPLPQCKYYHEASTVGLDRGIIQIEKRMTVC